MPFGLPGRISSSGGGGGSSSSPSNMHALDAEVLAAINGTASSSSSSVLSSSSSTTGPLTPRTSVAASVASSVSSSLSVTSAEDDSSVDSNSKESGGKKRRVKSGNASGGRLLGGGVTFEEMRFIVRSRYRKLRKRDRRILAAGMASLALLAFLGLSSSSGGGSSSGSSFLFSDARALARGKSVPPSLVNHLADLSSPDNSKHEHGHAPLPVFWHVLKSGGTSMKNLCADCFSLRVASEVGGSKVTSSGAAVDFINEDSLRVVEVNEGHRHVNVDTTTSAGIQRASQLGLAQSGLADVIFTPLLVQTADSILSPEYPGRMFALFRHPVHRAVSQFYYLRGATWEPTYNPAFAQMELADWAFTPHVESDWMVRSLVNKMEGPLTDDDLKSAKEIVKTRCLVGLLDRMDESVDRFRAYFGFGYDLSTGEPNQEVNECVSRRLGDKGWGNRSDHPFPIEEGDDVWNELMKKNGADVALYDYVRRLFDEQGVLVRGRAEERRREATAEAAADAEAEAEVARAGGEAVAAEASGEGGEAAAATAVSEVPEAGKEQTEEAAAPPEANKETEAAGGEKESEAKADGKEQEAPPDTSGEASPPEAAVKS